MHDNKTRVPRKLELTGILDTVEKTRNLEKNQDHLQISVLLPMYLT